MKYKLEVKALDDLNTAGSYIMGTITHMTESAKHYSCKRKQGVILIGCTIVFIEYIIYVHHFL